MSLQSSKHTILMEDSWTIGQRFTGSFETTEKPQEMLRLEGFCILAPGNFVFQYCGSGSVEISWAPGVLFDGYFERSGEPRQSWPSQMRTPWLLGAAFAWRLSIVRCTDRAVLAVRPRVERFDRRETEPFEPFEPFEFFQNRNFPESLNYLSLENSKISEN